MGTETLPIFEKLFLGGEYSIRGFDIRSVGPRDLASGNVMVARLDRPEERPHVTGRDRGGLLRQFDQRILRFRGKEIVEIHDQQR